MKPRDETPSTYLQALLQRTQALRDASGMTQQQMAGFLGIKTAAYKKYETRSPMPHHLIENFCILVGTDTTFFLTGKPAASAAKKIDKRIA